MTDEDLRILAAKMLKHFATTETVAKVFDSATLDRGEPREEPVLSAEERKLLDLLGGPAASLMEGKVMSLASQGCSCGCGCGCGCGDGDDDGGSSGSGSDGGDGGSSGSGSDGGSGSSGSGSDGGGGSSGSGGGDAGGGDAGGGDAGGGSTGGGDAGGGSTGGGDAGGDGGGSSGSGAAGGDGGGSSGSGAAGGDGGGSSGSGAAGGDGDGSTGSGTTGGGDPSDSGSYGGEPGFSGDIGDSFGAAVGAAATSSGYSGYSSDSDAEAGFTGVAGDAMGAAIGAAATSSGYTGYNADPDAPAADSFNAELGLTEAQAAAAVQGFSPNEVQAIMDVIQDAKNQDVNISMLEAARMAGLYNTAAPAAPATTQDSYLTAANPTLSDIFSTPENISAPDPNADVQFETTADPNEGLLSADPNADYNEQDYANLVEQGLAAPGQNLNQADPDDAYVSNPPAGDLAGTTGNMSGLGYGSPSAPTSGAPTSGAPTLGQPSDTSTPSDTITPYIPVTPPDYSPPPGGNGYRPPIYPTQEEMLTGERLPVPTPTAPVVNSQSLYDLQNFLSQGTPTPTAPTPTALPPITPYVGMPVGSPTGIMSAYPLPDYASVYFPTEPKKES